MTNPLTQTGASTRDFYRDIIDHAPVAMSILSGADFIIEFANKKNLELWQKSAIEVFHKPLFEVFPEVKSQDFIDMLSQVYHTGIPFKGEKISAQLIRNGTFDLAWFDIIYQPVIEESGKVNNIIVISTEVTEKVKASRKAEQNEKAIVLLADSIPYLVWLADANGKVNFYNRKLVDFDGALQDSPESWTDIIHPADLQTTLNAWYKAVNTGNDYVVKHRVKMKDGAYRWHVSRASQQNIDEEDYTWHGTSADIHDEVLLRERLKQVEDKLRLYENVVTKINDAIVITEAEPIAFPGPKILYVNEAFTDMTGYSYPEVVGKTPRVFQGAKTDRRKLARIRRSLENYEPVREELINYRRDGSEFAVEIDIVPVANERGVFTQFIAVQREITERKKSAERIEESEKRFRTLAETLPQLIWITDAKGHYEYISQQWYEYSGVQTNIERAWQEIVHAEDLPRVTQIWQDSLRTGKDYHAQLRLKNKDGGYRWHTVHGTAVRNNEDGITSWIGAFTDIHEQKLVEQKKDEFIHITTHELRTPITTASAYLQILEMNLQQEDIRPFVKKALAAISHMNELVTELSDLNMIQSGHLQYNMTIFDFNEMTDTAIEALQHACATHKIIKTGNSLQYVCGDKNRLQQVVINLINNGIKYSPEATAVFVEIQEEGNLVKFSVKDNGIGIQKNHLLKIFEKYYRIDDGSHFPGMGIGLYISHEIIKRHNGTMWVDSEYGKGSTFGFIIPAAG